MAIRKRKPKDEEYDDDDDIDDDDDDIDDDDDDDDDEGLTVEWLQEKMQTMEDSLEELKGILGGKSQKKSPQRKSPQIAKLERQIEILQKKLANKPQSRKSGGDQKVKRTARPNKDQDSLGWLRRKK